MQDTYHVDHNSRRRRIHRRRWLIAIISIVLLVAAGIWLRNVTQPKTTIHQSEPFNTTVSIAESKLKPTSLKDFEISLPSTWETRKLETGVTYSWRGTVKDDTARSLDIYQDTIPAAMSVNRLLPIKVEGNNVIPTDVVSDNCVNFTDVKTADIRTGAAPSKWSNVNFLCDTANKQRVVVGTSTAESINSATVSGTTVTHRYFFVYTDHSAQPNFDLFTRILATFKAL
jgi:hypothetical protein